MKYVVSDQCRVTAESVGPNTSGDPPHRSKREGARGMVKVVSLRDGIGGMRWNQVGHERTTRSAWNSRPLSVIKVFVFPFRCSGSSGHTITRSPKTTFTPRPCRASIAASVSIGIFHVVLFLTNHKAVSVMVDVPAVWTPLGYIDMSWLRECSSVISFSGYISFKSVANSSA